MSLFLSVWAGPGIAEGPGRPVPDNETAEAPTVGEYGDAEIVNDLTPLSFPFQQRFWYLYTLQCTCNMSIFKS